VGYGHVTGRLCGLWSCDRAFVWAVVMWPGICVGCGHVTGHLCGLWSCDRAFVWDVGMWPGICVGCGHVTGHLCGLVMWPGICQSATDASSDICHTPLSSVTFNTRELLDVYEGTTWRLRENYLTSYYLPYRYYFCFEKPNCVAICNCTNCLNISK
jgi:hypothetical protein